MTPCDFIVIGGGIAGASVAWHLAHDSRVVVLEREAQPGYHTTGRSAALFAESYGTAQVRALTLASRAFFEHPPAGFTEHPILADRGVLFVAGPGQQTQLDAFFAEIGAQDDAIHRVSADEVMARVPVMRAAWVTGGIADPLAADMDVHALHQGFLRGMRAMGGTLRCDAEVTALAKHGGLWRVRIASGDTFEAPVVVDAAGAWSDAIAALAGVAPIGLVPKRRTAFTFPAPAGFDTRPWPTVIGVDESFYFKPEAGQMLGSPANADPVPPQDEQPEVEDVAIGIDRIEHATHLSIRRPSRTWAGLRSFVADGDLVGGFALDAPGFFWCAAQGGYGIQTCAAMGEACASLARGHGLPDRLAAFDLTADMLSPARLRGTA